MPRALSLAKGLSNAGMSMFLQRAMEGQTMAGDGYKNTREVGAAQRGALGGRFARLPGYAQAPL